MWQLEFVVQYSNNNTVLVKIFQWDSKSAVFCHKIQCIDYTEHEKLEVQN